MHCDLSRELVSARLDGELAADEVWLLERHLDGCADCRRYVSQAGDLHRTLRVQPAPPVPDLTTAVLAHLDEPDVTERRSTRRRGSTLGWRVGLAAVGLAQLALAGPALIAHPDVVAEQHALHHLNAWTVAFAVGLLLVAWQPFRVRGVLPIATALAGVMIFTVVRDITNDHRVAMPATAHLLELAGLLLAWGLARRMRATGEDPTRGGHGRDRLPMLPSWLRPTGGRLDAWARSSATGPTTATARSDRAA